MPDSVKYCKETIHNAGSTLTPMAIEDAFVQDILAHPDDDAPRLIYADWLDEHNDPRGEFIRIQCALTQLREEDPRRWPLEGREKELLLEHESKWLPRGMDDIPCVFCRGFVERIETTPGQFLAVADHLFKQAPIRHLHLRSKFRLRRQPTMEESNVSMVQIATYSHLARLQGLTLSDLTLNQQDIEALLHSPHLQQLEELRLRRLHVAISRESYHFDLPDSLRLRHLDISHNSVHEGMIRALTELLNLDELTTLNLGHTSLSLEELRALVDSSSLASLRELNLSGNRLTHEVSRVLAESRLLAQLETLHLDSNLVGDAGAVAVGEWPELPHLMRLNLGNNHIFAGGFKALAEAPALRGLVSLDLSRNIGCDDGVIDLASADWTRLQALNLWFNGVGDRGVRALAQSQALSRLTWLNLVANCIGDVGAQALSGSRALPASIRLDLRRNEISEAEQRRLRERFGPFVYC